MRVPPSLMGQDKHMCKNTIFFPINNSFFNTKTTLFRPVLPRSWPESPTTPCESRFCQLHCDIRVLFLPPSIKKTPIGSALGGRMLFNLHFTYI